MGVPKVGNLCLKDYSWRSRYAHCELRTVCIQMEGTESFPKWYSYVRYAVPADLLPDTLDTGVIDVDCKHRQRRHAVRETARTPKSSSVSANGH